jgi:uncharacterized damage-inducible protein DinB
MRIADSLLPEFDQEMNNTRRTLERVPDEKFGWKAHEKSATMGWLAGHLANLPTWACLTLEQESFDLAPGGNPPTPPPPPATNAEVLAMFDKNAAAARAAIAAATDDRLLAPWSLKRAGNTLMTMPRIAVLRSFVLNHIIHHRAQMGVYLRLNNLPVPSIYGPSADESPF